MATIPVPGKCHFDEHGWLQGPIAITHVMTPNRYDSGFAVHGRGVVLHTEDGHEAGTVATFMNPASQASAFFSIGQSGACTQYLPVGQGYVAWTQGDGNGAWRGIEDEDGTHPSIPLTPEQIATFAQILEALADYDGFPLQVTDDINGTGLIWHGAGGQPWGGHFDCPGEVRKAQRSLIVELAKKVRQGHAKPRSHHRKTEVITTDGTLSWAGLAASRGIGSGHLLRLNGGPNKPFSADIAEYLNGAGDLNVPLPARIQVRVPVKKNGGGA